MDCSRERIIRIANQALVQTEKYQERSSYADGENYCVECILAKGNVLNIKGVLVYAFVDDEGITIHIRPENNGLDFEELCVQKYDSTLFDYDSDFFAKLENGYVILESTMDFHYATWVTVGEMVGYEAEWEEEVQYKKGLQEYLRYCKRTGITKESLVEGYQYNGLDIVAHCTKGDADIIKRQAASSPER